MSPFRLASAAASNISVVEPVLARATIHLRGFAPGEVRWVDPDSEYVRECFDAGHLVPEPTPPSEEEE